MVTYFYWWYGQELAAIWKATRVITKKIFYAFSIPILLRTLFDPWRRDVSSAENASLQQQFNLLINNIVSRLVGFILRLITIFSGILLTLLVFIILLLGFLFWLFFPLVIAGLFINGLRTVLNG